MIFYYLYSLCMFSSVISKHTSIIYYLYAASKHSTRPQQAEIRHNIHGTQAPRQQLYDICVVCSWYRVLCSLCALLLRGLTADIIDYSRERGRNQRQADSIQAEETPNRDEIRPQYKLYCYHSAGIIYGDSSIIIGLLLIMCGLCSCILFV